MLVFSSSLNLPLAQMSKQKFNVYAEKCQSRNILSAISDKWSILTITLLAQKIHRYGELKRSLEGISAKVLTHTLQKLEFHGLIKREEYDVLPLKVEYSLTQLGSELSQILLSLTTWTEVNMEAFIEAEKAYYR